MKEFLLLALSKRISMSARRIALAVGAVLNLANQGSAIFSNGEFSWLYVFLNYLMPFRVASYSAARNEVASHEAPRP